MMTADEALAVEYRHMPDVETVAVLPLDARGEPKGETVQDVAALFGDGVDEAVSGNPIATDGSSAVVWIFVASLPPEAILQPFCKIRREDGEVWTILQCPLVARRTRYECRCRRDLPNV